MNFCNRGLSRLLLTFGLSLSLPACAVFSTRPVQHLSYAETAFHAATLANAETTQPAIYQLAKDALLRARSAYRLKDFKAARSMAIRSRRLSEEAEWKAKKAEISGEVEASPGQKYGETQQ